MIKLAYWGAFGVEKRKNNFFSKNVIFIDRTVIARARAYISISWEPQIRLGWNFQGCSKPLEWAELQVMRFSFFIFIFLVFMIFCSYFAHEHISMKKWIYFLFPTSISFFLPKWPSLKISEQSDQYWPRYPALACARARKSPNILRK